ncbi:MAG TPA: sugar ABC transporter ATP-binding protein [Bauldia sp.]|nr:sugar ABC transporter ATP-binding protein [Bauldia sp.]
MLSLTAIEKSFGATRAVKSVTLEAAPGTVLGLAGENGAGKSTLIKIVAGVVAPDAGAMSLNAEPIAPRDTNEAIHLGISSVFQELTLVRELTVERNLLLTSAPVTPWGSIDRRKARATVNEILARYKLDIDPAARVGDLPLGAQQMLEILRAVERKPRVLLLDEATSALGASEVEWLADLVARLRDEGAIVLFISHRWDEVTRFCNRVAVLRNGELVSVADTKDVSEDEAVRLMTGQEAVESSFPDKLHSKDAVVLSATDLISRALRGVSVEVRKGEILGLGGLVGQGQGALLESLFGAHALTAGTIAVSGKTLAHLNPRRAIAAGLAYVPQERKTEGLLLAKSVAVNMTYATLGALRSFLGLIDLRAENELVTAAISRAQIRTRGPAEPIHRLSGGNQQKVLLEKWLQTKPAILLLNDVTRGVDIGTKRHIYALTADIAKSGVAVLWYSTDARELVGVVHRVLVMLGGRINAELTGEAVTVDRIVRASVMKEAADA